MDIPKIKAQVEASGHRRLDAIPRPVCLECQQPWPCDACEWTAIAILLVEALEEAQGKMAAIREYCKRGRSLGDDDVAQEVLAILGESE